MINPRPIRIDGDLAYVTLTKGHTAVINAEDVHLVAKWNWYADVQPHTVYAVRTHYSGGRKCAVLLHRQIVSAPDGIEVDHHNSNGLDNRRINLRIATPSQNMHNQRIRRDNSSGFKGVYWSKADRKWMAQITLHHKRCYLGRFFTIEEARAAYAAASAELHGGFGRAT